MTTAPTDLPDSWLALQVFLARQDMKVGRWQQKSAQRRNLHSTRPVIGAANAHVSMTTHGKRIDTVYLAIESIAAGAVLPARFILWLDDPGLFGNLPDSLRRLRDRGLEIHLTENFGPHTKYFPYLLSTEFPEVPLVIADDDVLYSSWWLGGLLNAWDREASVVPCYRAHVMRVTNGVIQPYRSWGPCESTTPSYYNFATGVSGCLYPPVLQRKIKQAGSAFMQLCPKADDIWLHVNALRHGFRARQILRHPLNFPGVEGTQDTGLLHTNSLSGNDDQIRRTYTHEDIATFLSAAVAGAPPPAIADHCLS
jgi:hypothetical protein